MTLSAESPGYPTRAFHGGFTVKVTVAQQWPQDAAECMEARLVMWHSAHCTLAALIKKQADLILLFRGGFCFRWAEVHVGDPEMRSSSSIWWLKCCQLQDFKTSAQLPTGKHDVCRIYLLIFYAWLAFYSINLGPQPWRISNHRWLKCVFVCFCVGIQNDRKLRKKWQKGCFLIALFCLNQQRNSELSLENSSFLHQWFRLQTELFVSR